MSDLQVNINRANQALEELYEIYNIRHGDSLFRKMTLISYLQFEANTEYNALNFRNTTASLFRQFPSGNSGIQDPSKNHENDSLRQHETTNKWTEL